MNNELNLHDGFWNGKPAKFRVVLGVVGEEPKELEEHFQGKKRYLWFVPYIGKEMQMVEVHQGEKPFYLANTDGSGVEKVTVGLGSPRAGHYSVYPSLIIAVVPKEHWQIWSRDVAEIFSDEIDELWTQRDPHGYKAFKEKTASLLAAMRRNFFTPNPRKG